MFCYPQYPAGIADMPYNPAFAVRGLHFDIGKSLLVKIGTISFFVFL